MGYIEKATELSRREQKAYASFRELLSGPKFRTAEEIWGKGTEEEKIALKKIRDEVVEINKEINKYGKSFNWLVCKITLACNRGNQYIDIEGNEEFTLSEIISFVTKYDGEKFTYSGKLSDGELDLFLSSGFEPEEMVIINSRDGHWQECKKAALLFSRQRG